MNSKCLHRYIIDSLKNRRIYELKNKLEEDIKIYSRCTIILNLLGILNFKYCRFKTAEKLWVKSYLIDGNDNSKKYICMIARDEYRELVQKYNCAIEFFKAGNYFSAIENLETVIIINGDLIEPYILLALCYYKVNKLKKSLEYIKKANELDKSNYRISNIYREIERSNLIVNGIGIMVSLLVVIGVVIGCFVVMG